jgi:two-component system chemotaxis response regulator CheY
MLCVGDEPAPHDVPVLLVDDDPHFCSGLARALESTPLRPMVVHGGAAALRFLTRAQPYEDAPQPAFVLLDFNLPDLTATAVLADIRRTAALATIPVLVISQIPGAADEAAALAAGADAYRAKPSRSSALRELVVEFWKTHRGPDGDPGR